MGHRLNHLDEPVFMAVPKPMLTEFGIHYRLESCERFQQKLTEEWSDPTENPDVSFELLDRVVQYSPFRLVSPLFCLKSAKDY